jgi:hypothetical protein
MSLDLSASGLSYNGTKVAGTSVGLAALTLGDFDSGDDASLATTLILQLDNSGTPSADIAADLPAPSALGVVGGTKLVVVNDTNGKKVTFIDPITGITFNYVNRAGEAITLGADGDGDQWVMSF